MTSALKMEKANPGASQQCSSCDDPSARYWCMDCKEALCDICVSAHRRVTVTRSHQILNQPPAAGILTPPTKFCRLHPSEQLKLFCLTCNQLTCRDCQLMTHMTHRYNFANEALGILKKQLEVQVQPIRVQIQTVCQSLLDMETRLQDINVSDCLLKKNLLDSYNLICQQLKKRMKAILEDAEKVSKVECDMLQRRMKKLMHLQQKQQLVTKMANKALISSDLLALTTYVAQVESQMKTLGEENISTPVKMSELKVVTDRETLQALLEFGHLEVSWVLFSVSPTSKRKTPVATCSSPTAKPLPQNSTTINPDPPVNCPSRSTSLSINQSDAPLTTTTAVIPIQPVRHLSSSNVKTPSHLGTNSPVSTVVSFGLLPSTGPPPSCTLRPIQPSLVLNQPPGQCPAAAATSQTVYQMQPMMLGQQVSLWQQNNCVSQLLPLVTSTCTPATWSILPKTSTTINTDPPVNCPSTSTSLSINQSDTPLTTTTAVIPIQPVRHLSSSNVKTPSHLGMNSPVSTVVSFGLLPSTGPPPSCTLRPIQPSLVLNQPPSQCPAAAATSQTVYQMQPRMLSQQVSLWQQNNCVSQLLPVVTSTCTPATWSPLPQTSTTNGGSSSHCTSQNSLSSLPALSSSSSSAVPPPTPTCPLTATASNTLSSDQCLVSDITSSSLKQQQSPVVRAVVDSACDQWVQEVTERQQEPAENEPTSTMSEETAPEEPSSVTGQLDCSLSQLQPRVYLFKLPVSPPRPRGALSGFSLVPVDDGDEIYVEDDVQSQFDDITELLSPPESPATLQMVDCSACGSANASIVCSDCGRGYHRDCHVPPIGPDIWSEWICSLCQDLSDPSDPYGSDRTQTPHSPGLSVLDQRDDDVLEKLKESFQSRLMETFSSDLHPSALIPPRNSEVRGHQEGSEVRGHQEASEVTDEGQEVIGSKFKLSKLRNRLREFMEGTLEPKRMKME